MNTKTKEYFDKMKLYYDRSLEEQEEEKTKIFNEASKEDFIEEYREAESKFYTFMIREKNKN